jgi:hypothetical protein
LALLPVGHCAAYALDTADREHPNDLSVFPLLFMPINLLTAEWTYLPQAVLWVRIGVLAAGLVCGCGGLLAVRWFIGQKLLRLRFCGADSGISCDGVVYNVWVGAVLGLYCGAVLFNSIVTVSFPSDAPFGIATTMSAVTSIQGIRAYWIASLIIDYSLLLTIVDSMSQLANPSMCSRTCCGDDGSSQAASEVVSIQRTDAREGGDPHAAVAARQTGSGDPHPFRGFGECIARPAPRFAFFYPMWAGGVAALLVTVLIYERTGGRTSFELFEFSWYAPATGAPSDNNAFVALAVCSTCMFIAVVSACLDWSWPTHGHPPLLASPLFPFVAASAMWPVVALATLLVALDGRFALQHVYQIMARPTFWSPREKVLLTAALLPIAVAVVILLVTMLRCSAWCTPSFAVAFLQDAVDDHVMSESTPSPDRVRAIAASPGAAFSDFSSMDVLPGTLTQKEPSPMADAADQRWNIWRAALANDVMRVAMCLERFPEMLNERGGPGLECTADPRYVGPPTKPRAKVHTFAAAPLHYAIAGNAAAVISLLLDRGADTACRTVCGLYTCRELVQLMPNCRVASLIL